MDNQDKKLKLLKENHTSFYIYEEDIKKIPSKTMNVFYNKKMILNRDVTSLSIKAFKNLYNKKNLILVDPMAASGVGSIRILNECDGISKIYINDLNPVAVDLIKKNIELNNLDNIKTEIIISKKDANFLLSEIVHNIYMTSLDNTVQYPNVINIDPFGTPNIYLDSAMKAILKKKGLLCVTATDTAVLFGVRPKACIRKYMAKPLNCEFTKEIGARILLYFISKIANINNLGIIPILTFYSKHFIRIFALTFKNKNKISKFFNNFGFGVYCKKCGYRDVIPYNQIFKEISCKLCNNDNLDYAGPLWIANLHDKNFVNSLVNLNKECEFNNQKNIAKILEIISQEINMPRFYYNTHKLSRKLKLKMIPKLTQIINMLRKKGYKASRTHFDFESIKTDATINEISKIMEILSN